MIVVSPDKFKGTLSAHQAGQIMAGVLRAHGLDAQVFPMADGGEGTRSVIEHTMFDVRCVESCSIPAEGSILTRSTYELGLQLIENLRRGITCQAIGGTCTADGGTGLLQALGYKFLRRDGSEIKSHMCPALLTEVSDIKKPDSLPFELDRLIGLADVEASLLPPGLSAMDFLTQKGAGPEDKEVIFYALRNLESILGPGGKFAGAGGGLGYALQTALGARVISGAEFIGSHILPAFNVEAVFTGEGAADFQTAGGKVVGFLERYAQEHDAPLWVLAGTVHPDTHYEHAYGCVPWGAPVPENPAEALRLLTEKAVIDFENYKRL